MGCGESKHAVATGNTISQRMKLSDDVTKKSKDTETIPEKLTNDANTNSLVQKCQAISQNRKEDSAGGNAKAVADEEVVNENAVLKEGDDIKESNEKKEGGDVKEGDEERKLNDAVEEKGSVEETKTVTINEPTKGNEEDLIKEAKVVPTVEPKDSIVTVTFAAEQVKLPNTDEVQIFTLHPNDQT
ncbi:hypothetical protein F0562_000223 [Nyssa sinensis]|uniref:Uncharacterized protein n=1 Tax=Nyssa sinensis TaxID=561372 RepID=A0A5J5C318_9ASTE|nr:hypothetical protein F0562_000223 [Nyssa sinensis]